MLDAKCQKYLQWLKWAGMRRNSVPGLHKIITLHSEAPKFKNLAGTLVRGYRNPVPGS